MTEKRTVLRATTMGFCMGVQRAVDLVRELLDRGEEDLYLLGPLIHNPHVMTRLLNRGVVLQPDPEKIPPGVTVIIRAHGMAPGAVASLKARNIRVVDATCPRVIRSQKLVEMHFNAGRTVILAGDAHHGEIQALEGFAPGRCFVVGSQEEVRSLPAIGRAAVVAQTTIKREEYEAICGALEQKIVDLVVEETICRATKDRQEALRELGPRCGGLLVVGGRNSANTTRLYRTAREYSEKVWHIESPEEIPREAFDLDVIGITAGASTPEETIAAVERRLRYEE